MWKIQRKIPLILLDLSTIHRVIHNPVENRADFSTVFHRKIELAKSPKFALYTLIHSSRNSVCNLKNHPRASARGWFFGQNGNLNWGFSVGLCGLNDSGGDGCKNEIL
jgi:hypothetical protein